MRDGDDATSATQQAETVQDIRISQGWDSSQNLGKVLDKLSTCIRSRGTYISSTSGNQMGRAATSTPHVLDAPARRRDPKLLLCENPTRLNVEVGKLLAQMKLKFVEPGPFSWRLVWLPNRQVRYIE